MADVLRRIGRIARLLGKPLPLHIVWASNLEGIEMEVRTDRRATIALWISAASAVLAAVGVLLNLDSRFDLLGSKSPNPQSISPPPSRLTEDNPSTAKPPSPPGFPDSPPLKWTPAAPLSPTIVSFENGGVYEALVQWVEFAPRDVYRTPSRMVMAGEGPTIPVVFNVTGHRKRVGTLRYDLPTPRAAPGDHQFTTLKVALVWPEYVGYSYLGRLTIHFAGNKTLTEENVELDVLKAIPSASQPD